MAMSMNQDDQSTDAHELFEQLDQCAERCERHNKLIDEIWPQTEDDDTSAARWWAGFR